VSSTTILLKDNGELIVEEYNRSHVHGERIMEAIGGFFEHLSCGRIDLWFLELPKDHHRPNFNATMVGASFKQSPIPVLKGPVLVTGPPDDHQLTTGLTHDQVERILKLTR
jgi:hypothetical protein